VSSFSGDDESRKKPEAEKVGDGGDVDGVGTADVDGVGTAAAATNGTSPQEWYAGALDLWRGCIRADASRKGEVKGEVYSELNPGGWLA
jgi:hypothetical protein